MEENLGRTTIDVDVLLGPARKQLDQMRAMTEKIAGDAGDAGGRSLGARLASGVGGAMAAIGRATAIGATALAGLGAVGAKAGLQTAAGMEQADIAFTTMLGSAEKADTFLRDLASFASKTPFEFPELQTAASSLVSAGVSADKVIPIMTSLGNATSGMGTGADGVKRATVALQQMSAAGRITGEDLNQLRDAGVPVFDLLAAATGKSVEQVAKLAQEGKLGREELTQLMGALESGAGLERFTGLMDKQSQSLKGMWSTLKDTMNMGLAEAIQPLIPLIKDGLGAATQFVADQMPRIATGLASVASWGQVAYGILFQGDYKGGLVAGLSEDSGAIDTLFKIREAALAVLDAVRSGDVGQLSAGLSSVTSAGGGAFSILKSISGMLPDVATLVGAAADAIGFLADHADKLAYVLPVLAGGWLLYKSAQIAGNWAALLSLPIQVAQVLSNFALAAAIRGVGSASTTSAAKQAVANMSVQTSSFKTAAAAVLAGAKVVGSWVKMGVQSLLQAGRMAAAWVIAMGPVGWIIAAVVGLVALIVANWDKVKEWTVKAWNAVSGAVSGAWNAVTGAISSGIDSAVSFVRGLPGKILGALGNLGSLLLNAGGDLIRGFIRGIGDMAGRVAQAAIDVAKKAVNGIKNFLGISSPSKVFAGIGANVGQGLVGGMLAQTASVKRATMALAAAAMATPLTLATPSMASGDAAGSTMATASRAAAAAAAGPPGSAADGATTTLQVHAYEGQSVRSVATEVVNLGTWATKIR